MCRVTSKSGEGGGVLIVIGLTKKQRRPFIQLTKCEPGQYVGIRHTVRFLTHLWEQAPFVSSWFRERRAGNRNEDYL